MLHQETGYLALIGFKRVRYRMTGKVLGKVEMQPHIQVIFLCQFGRAIGICHENHGADGCDSPSPVTSESRIGLGPRTAPVVSVDDQHSSPTNRPTEDFSV